jgi:hypothetical protein
LQWWHGLLFLIGLIAAAWFNANLRAAIELRQFWRDLWFDLVAVGSTGAAIGGLLLAMGQSLQHSRTFPTRVGHWLLLMAGAGWLAQVCFLTIEAKVGGDELLTGRQSANLLTVRALLFLVASLMHWAALRQLRGDKLAQSYVLLLMVNLYWISIVPLLGERAGDGIKLLNIPLTWLTLGVSLFALVRDIRHPQSRDDLHWAGWIAQVAILIVGMIPVIYYLILFLRTLA